MEFNESQQLVIGAITTAMLGIPNIQAVFTKEIIGIVLQNPAPLMIFLVSILKLGLVVISLDWLIKLAKNIEFTYNRHPRTFWDYIGTLILTGLITFIIMYILLQKI